MSTAFLVTGATGKQGGALVKSLIEQPGFSPTTHIVYCVTRDVSSGSAKRLAALSPAIKPIQGRIEDAAGIFAQLDPKPVGMYVVHVVSGSETRNCNALVDEGLRHGVRHIVFSSVERHGPAGDSDPTDVPHFITKFDVETHIKAKAEASGGALTYTFLRPVFFLDNLGPTFFGKVATTAWRDVVGQDKPMQVIDARDIGIFGALALMKPDDPKFHNKSLDLAGDEITFAEANKIWKSATGEDIPTTYGFVMRLFLMLIKDLAIMFRWIRNVGFAADIAQLNTIIPMTTFKEYVEREIAPKYK